MPPLDASNADIAFTVKITTHQKSVFSTVRENQSLTTIFLVCIEFWAMARFNIMAPIWYM